MEIKFNILYLNFRFFSFSFVAFISFNILFIEMYFYFFWGAILRMRNQKSKGDIVMYRR